MGSFFIVLHYFSFQLFLLMLLTQFTSYTFSLCNHHENSALLQFKKSLIDSSPFPHKIKSWKNGTNCCDWDGVTCDDVSGHVIGLDLNNNNLKGELHPNSTIFQLKYLQKLNLAFNDFSGSSIHDGIGDLVNLTHLNLSNTQIKGIIPSTISHLSKLVSLDLTTYIQYIQYMELKQMTWKKLIRNATNLREIRLDNVDMSSIRERSLSLLMNLASTLVFLSLQGTGLQTNFPIRVLSLPNLQELDLSLNNDLTGKLPIYSKSISLRYLDLSSTAFSGEIPYSISHLNSLTHLDLSNDNFDGFIPQSLWNLTQLSHLDLSNNKFYGEIPSSLSNLTHLTHMHLDRNKLSGLISNVFHMLIKLEYLTLSHNNLIGPIPSSLFYLTLLSYLDLSSNKLVGPIPIEITKLSKLGVLSLAHNMLNGTIPPWCYNLPSLTGLYLDHNQLTGFIDEFSTYSLQVLFLSNNNLQGHFPNSIFELQNLTYLVLSSNNLSGILDFHKFSKNTNLQALILSHNTFLSINITSTVDTILPNLGRLFLSSTNMNGFPKLLAQVPNLVELDLSNNKIHGKIPKWFHKRLLNSWTDITNIDLSFNKLQGDLPIPPYGIQYFLLSNNNFTGHIPMSLCNASSLNVLNLARNNLIGTIPQCLGTFPTLSVLDIQMNNLNGSMPRIFSKENAFETIKLNGNNLKGPLPHSLAHCTKLEVLDLGNNNIEETFPNWIETLQELQVLSLRSNKFHGTITCSNKKHPFPKLRIYDVSGNNFSGPLPTSCLKNFQGMMNVSDNTTVLRYMGKADYYNDSMEVVMKGFSIVLTRILTTFTTIDLSYNMFEGEIPQVIGELYFLKGLNLSNNRIIGTIPQSLSNLRNLEWLDLSRNQLTGEIPTALTKLNFLSFLNLSQNHLEGTIPAGQQFNTFGNDSYEGNTMLCGFPLSKSCKNNTDQPHSTHEDAHNLRFGWKPVIIGYACGTIFGILLGYNVFLIGKPQWLARFFQSMFCI
ncbi:unnamed protein product [Vicia faba]|uniref:Leucine-rich repeat-containing N-terminal plant-type domain-containing protein n=1 Tax=Vicia faba TaxID=3906 RepID=A0AAV0YW27_VICFA|nr:unnamed protein product [Vicia faba]